MKKLSATDGKDRRSFIKKLFGIGFSPLVMPMTKFDLDSKAPESILPYGKQSLHDKRALSGSVTAYCYDFSSLSVNKE